MTITELSIKRPILIIVFFIVTTLLGIFALGQLKYELLPKINAPFVTIMSIYAGASPSEIENSLTKKIEDAIAGVSKIRRITSRSNEGYSIIGIEFIQDSDLDEALQDVQRAVNQILPELPSGAKTPSVDKYSLSDLPILRLAATANISQTALYQLVKDQIKPRLSQLKGVGRIQLIGGEEREIKVYLDEEKLKFHHISALQVVDILQKSNLEIPIGNIKAIDAEFGLRLSGKINQFETLKNLIISQLPDGSKIYLKDIAEIKDQIKDDRTLNRLNQQAALGITIQKQGNANAVEVSAKIKAELEKITQEYAKNQIHFEIAADSSEFTLKATEVVFKDLLIAIVLVAIVMLVFLHSLRNALMVMLAIPTSLVFAFIGMWLMDFSLNLMTLLAMSLVIGILVDDSIVVLENIYRHLEMGKDSRTAALDGRNEIGFSALSITLVDVVVFLPLAFVPGITGGLVKEFALVIVVSTLASLLVCFTLTPMLASRFAKLTHLSSKNLFGKIALFFEKQIEHFTHFYLRILKFSLQRRWLIYTLSLTLLIASFALVTEGFIGGEFITSSDKGEIAVTVELPTGTKFLTTNELAKKFETQISKIPEVKKILTSVGVASDPFFGESQGANQLEMNVSLTDKEERTKSVLQVSQMIRNLILQEPGAKVKVAPIGLIGAEATPIQLLISGANRDSVLAGAEKLKDLIEKIEGTDDVRLSVLSGKPELDIRINRERLASLGLTLEEVGTALRVAMTGFDDLKFRVGDTEFPLRVQLAPNDRARTEQLANLTLINQKGESIYLKQVADIQRITSPSALERRNKNASVMLFSKAIGKSVNTIGEEIKAILAKNPLPNGVNLTYEGDLELADDSFTYLGLALLAGIIFVYLIMVALYNSFLYPLVVLFSIPVALIGALLALALTMKTLNVFSIFGIIMLLGLVAKNAILLVDRANELKSQGRNALYALLDAGKTRLRPILMTTLAMVIGMLPLALGTGAGSEFNSALAWVLIGGLTSSMFLTLVLVPSVYLEFEYFLKLFQKKNKKQNQAKNHKPLIIKQLTNIGVLLLILIFSQNLFAQKPSPQPSPKEREKKTPLSVGEGQGVRLNLIEAEALVKAQNPELKNAQKDVQKANFTIQEARGNYLPTLNFQGTYNRNLKPQVFFLPANTFDPTADPNRFQSIAASAKNVYQGGLNFSLPLLQFENQPIMKTARLTRQSAELNLTAQQLQKVAEVRRAYYAALLAKAQSAFVLENLERQNQVLNELRNRLQLGFLSESDTLPAYIQVENLKPQILKAENAYKIAEAQLKLLLDLPAEQEITLTDELVLPTQVIDNQTIEKITNRPDLQNLRLQSELYFQQIKIEKARLLPNLQFIAQYAWLTQAEDFKLGNYTWVNTQLIGLQLNVPIFNGFRGTKKIQQIQIQQQQAEIQYRYATRQADLEVETYSRNLREIGQQISLQAKVISVAERSYNLIKDRLMQGLAKQGELQDAELALRQAKSNRIELIYNYLTTEAELKRAKGM
ncbi:MAG: efflux RND transporter permease subunit [Microscillaceae bacterium]|jgi:hydrophobe/amphiphile efflux-1 (HAE1) family protein|nr:efflux RND transporter permease subunit [Microscillaceae bacterium]